MYFLIVKNYIDKMTTYDIKKYCNDNNIQINDKEVEIIYSYIKRYWTIVWQNVNNIYPLFDELKKVLSPSVYKKMVELFNNYSDKYFFNNHNY